MKKMGITFITLSCFLVASLLLSTPASAYTGVRGRAVDLNGQPWTHGGTIFISNRTTGAIAGTGSLGTDGRFNISYSTPPAVGNQLKVFIVYNNGGNGTPQLAEIDYTEQATASQLDLGDISTGTGPLAVTLHNSKANQPTPLASEGWLVSLLFLVLGGITVGVAQRYTRGS